MQAGRCALVCLSLGHEAELAPCFIGVDDRGRVLGVLGDIGDLCADGRRAVHGDGDGIPDVQGGRALFRYEEADLHVAGGQELDDGASCGHPFADPVERVVDEAGLGRTDFLLAEFPAGLGEGGFIRFHCGLLGRDALFTLGEVIDVDLFLHLHHGGVRRAGHGALVVKFLLRNGVLAVEGFHAGEFGGGVRLIGPGLRELGLCHGHFRRAFSREHIVVKSAGLGKTAF